MNLPTELTDKLKTMEAALTECFGGYTDTDGWLTVECCGPVTYGSGCIGSDIVRCKACGRSVINVLSPHVSPLLIRGSTTSLPSDELVEAIGERCWLVVLPDKTGGNDV